MESTIVVKVKYGETLRRFNARVDEAGKLELDINGLREKVLSLFSLSPDADFSLTYLDEDGDSVTVADEEDLYDVMRQSLNPLRITVKVNYEKASSSNARSSGNSTPMRLLPRVSHPLPNLNSSVSEIFKDIPEPIGEALSKLSVNLASKAVSSSSHLPELVQHFAKLLQLHMIPVSDSQVGTDSGSQPAGSENVSKLSSMTKKPEASGDVGTRSKVVPVVKSEMQPIKAVAKDFAGGTTGEGTLVCPVTSSLNLNTDHHRNFKDGVKISCEGSSKTEAGKPAWENIKAVASSVLGSNGKEVKKLGDGSVASDASDTYWDQNIGSKTIYSGGGTSTDGPLNQNVAGECPFIGLPVANESAVPYTHIGPRVHPFKRSYNQGGVGGIFHRGVRCDGCGVHPITGPRFKSKVKEDYDLCSICFSEIGSEADYSRLDRPIPYRHPHPSKGLYEFARVSPPTLPHGLRGLVKSNRGKLDSRFIMDVNVSDGTVMAPTTSFVKIWRMRNNGTLVWPQGTQLVWIGGDRFSASDSVELQIAGDGLPVGNELEVAVDFTAPAMPGRYISYWRMASPSGQKFGQRVWVFIQVDASLKDTECNNFQGLNLNMPPENSGMTGAESITINNVEPIVVDGQLPKPVTPNMASELVEALVMPHPTNDQDLNFPINDNLLVSGVSITSPLEADPTLVSFPTVDLSTVEPVVASVAPPRSTDAGLSSQPTGGKDDVEQTLLLELEKMGFNQVDLNKEILRMNEYNLEQSVDDLCGVSEWDPILEELQEMGFCDNEVNKKLLKKNNGSIKGVVMDLITREKA